MKIFSIQSYNSKSKVNPKQNKNVSFAGTVEIPQEVLSKILNNYRVIQFAVLKRFNHKPELKITTDNLTDYEQEYFQMIFKECREELKKAEGSSKGTKVTKTCSENMITGHIIESGSASAVEGGKELLAKTSTPDLGNCISYTIFSKTMELNDDFCRIIFDENGSPKILAYLNKDGIIKHAFIPNMPGV